MHRLVLEIVRLATTLATQNDALFVTLTLLPDDSIEIADDGRRLLALSAAALA